MNVKSLKGMHGDDAAGPSILKRNVLVFCIAIIAIGHLLEEARGYGWTSRMFPNHWEYIYRIADTSVAIAFASLMCWVIWFSHKHLTPFFVAPILGLLVWSENELKSRAFFGAFLQTIDWWQWAAIDASLAVLVAIFLKPIVQKSTDRKIGAMALSIADLFLATLASAVLLIATRSIATLPASPENPSILFCGWPQTLMACGTGILTGGVAAATIYIAIAGNWKLGLFVYVCTCLAYFGATNSVMISNGKIALQSFSASNLLVSPSDPLFIVFVLFAAGMLAIRYRCERMQRVDAN